MDKRISPRKSIPSSIVQLVLLLPLLLLVLIFYPYVLPHRQPPVAEQACSHPSLSCPDSQSAPVDSCCVNHPSGHFLLTQFWDTKPALGPSDSWTIHGLWPDLCSGGFDQFCDQQREYSNISAILQDASSAADLLSYMKENWRSINGDDNHLWAHEWNKHGTCVSTLDTGCYSSDSEAFDAVLDYFNHAARLYSTLNTYQILAKHHIHPSHEHKYDLQDFQTAISSFHGDQQVTFRCRGNELDEIWYHFHVRGSLRHATPFNSSISSLDAQQLVQRTFVPAAPDGAKTNCPRHGIRYLPKDSPGAQPSYTSAPSTKTSTTPSSPNPTSAPNKPFSGRGHLVVRVLNSSLDHKDPSSSSSSPSSPDFTGCLIRGGKWYATQGPSCATYIAKEDPNHLSNTPFGSSDSKLAPHGIHQIQHDQHAQPFPLPPLPQPPDIDTPHPIKPLTTDNYPSELHSDPDKEPFFFTLSSLYSPCAILKSSKLSTGVFTCASDLGVQSIFSYKNISSKAYSENSTTGNAESNTKSGYRIVLAVEDETRFYAKNLPGRFEKVDLYVDFEGGEAETKETRVEVEIEWESL